MRAVLFSLLVVCVSLAAGCNKSSIPDRRALPPVCEAAIQFDPGSDADMARLRSEIAQGQTQSRAAERLGYRLIARARLSNDPEDYTLAEKAADCIDVLQPGDPAALLLRGHVLHQLHRFREAEAAAVKLVAARGGVLDYGLLGDVLMERGRLGEAAGAYQKMIDLKPFYQSYTRAAHLRWLKGDLTGAVTLMERAVASASPRDPESGAWANTRLSHYELQRGRLDEANRAAGAALAHVREYPAALLALGRVQLASGQTAEALDSLRRAVAHNPLPEYQWTLADALSAAGRDQEAAAVERELTASGERADPRTLALFLSTRVLRSSLSSVPGLPGQPVDASSGGHALGLARAEALERGDVFTLDAIAWAQLADGRVEDARQTIGRAVAEGTRDARLFLHAAVIAAASGHRADALRWSRQAHAIRFTLLPSELDLLDRSRTPRTFGTRGTPGTLGTR